MSNQTQSERTRSAFVVWAYIFLYESMLLLQYFTKMKMPVDGATWALLFVVGSYVGMSQFAAFVTTKKLPDGFRYTGNYKKLLRITVAMFVLSITGVIINTAGSSVPVDNLLMASGLTAGLFAGGNKSTVAAEKKEVSNE